MPALRSNWERLWRSLGAAGDGQAVYDDLIRRWSEPTRFYHDVQHLEVCLTEFSAVEAEGIERDLIEFALWFHDAVYDPKAADNEERSAELAVRVAGSAGCPDSFSARVVDLILATKRHGPAADRETAVLLDVDLSILGQSAEQFDRYEEQVRQEYAWVPETVFAPKRAEILTTFLARPRIYQTVQFQARYELAARANLQRSIERLKPS